MKRRSASKEKSSFWPGGTFGRGPKLAWTGPFGLFGLENGIPAQTGTIRPGFAAGFSGRPEANLYIPRGNLTLVFFIREYFGDALSGKIGPISLRA